MYIDNDRTHNAQRSAGGECGERGREVQAVVYASTDDVRRPALLLLVLLCARGSSRGPCPSAGANFFLGPLPSVCFWRLLVCFRVAEYRFFSLPSKVVSEKRISSPWAGVRRLGRIGSHWVAARRPVSLKRFSGAPGDAGLLR